MPGRSVWLNREMLQTHKIACSLQRAEGLNAAASAVDPGSHKVPVIRAVFGEPPPVMGKAPHYYV
jgi:hypothetical protein